MTTTLRASLLAAVLGGVVVGAQPIQTPPRPIAPPTNAEITSAIRSSDRQRKETVIARATQAPAESLRMETIIAISNEVVSMMRPAADRPTAPDETTATYLGLLIEVLARQKNPAGIDGLAAVAHLGPIPRDALVEFGETALPVVIRGARTQLEPSVGHAAGSMEVLRHMLESPTVRPTLSSISRAAIRQVAADRFRSTTGNDNWATLASAASLAVATGDPQLRQEVENLIDNDAEFARRSIDSKWQQEVSKRARQALEGFPAP